MIDEAALPYIFLFVTLLCGAVNLNMAASVQESYIIITAVWLVLTTVYLMKVFDVGSASSVRNELVSHFKEWTSSAFHASLATISRIVINRSDVLVLGFLVSSASLGLYSAAFRLTYIATFLPVLISAIYAKKLSVYWEKKEYDNFFSTCGEIRNLSLILLIPMMIVALFYAENIIVAVYGHEFVGASYLFQWLIFGQTISGALSWTAAALLACGQEALYGKINLIIMGVSVVAMVGLVHTYGEVAAAIVTAAALSVSVLAQYIVLRIVRRELTLEGYLGR
jgi:O-antigen/teichoic acid export membrane protein